MWFHASDTIANNHPELRNEIQKIDSFLRNFQGAFFRLENEADILGIEANTFGRIIDLYKIQKVVSPVQVFFCPKDEGTSFESIDGEFIHCDLCDQTYVVNECQNEIAYRVLEFADEVQAQPTMQFDQGLALIVGINSYEHLFPLGKATTDAEDLYQLLSEKGYPRKNMALLLDKEATRANISDRLNWLAVTAKSDVTVLVFFSGHGVQRLGGFDRGEYLCPVDTDINNLRISAISDDNLTEALRVIPAKRIVVLLDACHSGGVGRPKDAAVQGGLSEESFKKLLSSGEGRAILTSCKPDEYSYEPPDLRNGLFSHYLLEGLRGKAVTAPQMVVGIYDLANYVQTNVKKERADQTPVFKGDSIDSNFPIVLVNT